MTPHLEHGGDRETQGTKHYVPWGRQSPERIRSDFSAGGRGELARARARLERAVDKPVAKPTSLKHAAEQKLAAKKKVSGAKSFNKWLDKNHQPTHTLAAALHEYEKKHGYKRGHHSLQGGEHKAPDRKWGDEYGKFLAKTHPVGHTLHDAGVHPDTYHPGTTSPSKVCQCVWGRMYMSPKTCTYAPRRGVWVCVSVPAKRGGRRRAPALET